MSVALHSISLTGRTPRMTSTRRNDSGRVPVGPRPLSADLAEPKLCLPESHEFDPNHVNKLGLRVPQPVIESLG